MPPRRRPRSKPGPKPKPKAELLAPPIGVRLPRTVLAQLEHAAGFDDVGVAHWVRRAIVAELSRRGWGA